MKHSYDLRAQVQAALISGEGVCSVARKFGLAQSSVRWMKRDIKDKLPYLPDKAKRDFGEMLAAYLEALLTTAKAQQEHFRDKAWLNQQTAADLAILHGVSIDKGVRLFEAAQLANQSAAGEPEQL